jgi:hypothetical protein
MLIELNEEQCSELQGLLESSLGDLSTEIARTDNPEYRGDCASGAEFSSRCSTSSTTRLVRPRGTPTRHPPRPAPALSGRRAVAAGVDQLVE